MTNRNRVNALLLPALFYTALTQGLTCSPEAIGAPPPSVKATPVTTKATPATTPSASPAATPTAPIISGRALCPNGCAASVCMACYDYCPVDPMLLSQAKASSPFGIGDQCFCQGNIPPGFTKDEENILLGKWTHVDKRDFLNPFPPEEALTNPVLLLHGWWRSLDATNPNSPNAPRADLTGVTVVVRTTLLSGDVVEVPVPLNQPSCAVDLPSTFGNRTPAHVFTVEVPLVFPEPVTFVHIVIKVPNLTNECFTASWRAYLIA